MTPSGSIIRGESPHLHYVDVLSIDVRMTATTMRDAKAKTKELIIVRARIVLARGEDPDAEK
jgi:hypothetical protein